MSQTPRASLPVVAGVASPYQVRTDKGFLTLGRHSDRADGGTFPT